MQTKMIDVVHRGPVGIITLRRPPANAMNIELLEEMTEVFERLGQDKSLRSVVLTGQGNSSCAGVDLKAVPHYNDADQRPMVVALNRAFFAVYSFPGPVVDQRPRDRRWACPRIVLRLAYRGESSVSHRSDRGSRRRTLSRRGDGGGSPRVEA
jgi:hypothetical protein